VEAACKRGEHALFVSFDSDAAELIRNLCSVNIRLQRFVKNGLFHIESARGITGSAEIHLMRIRRMARDHKARCLVIDPVSALSKGGTDFIVHGVAERLIDWAKSAGITLLCTSLLDGSGSAQLEGTPMQISTIADTWIHLNYVVNAGERNRGLSIIKSRGTAHSNQVRELILDSSGVTLADAYLAGGQVLMGTLRWEKEMAERNAQLEAESILRKQRAKIQSSEAEIHSRIAALQSELELMHSEKHALDTASSIRKEELEQRQIRIRDLRMADVSRRAKR
jgi:circadian clock protein KaiC